MDFFYGNVFAFSVSPYLDPLGLGSHRLANKFPSQWVLTPFQMYFHVACIFTHNGIFFNGNCFKTLKTCNFLLGVSTDLLCTGHNSLWQKHRICSQRNQISSFKKTTECSRQNRQNYRTYHLKMGHCHECQLTFQIGNFHCSLSSHSRLLSAVKK